MKKILKILLPILAFAQTSIAAEENGLTIKPKGSFDFSIGALKDNGPHTKKTVTANKNGYGFLSSASVSINVENRIEDDIAYGAKVALVTATRSDRKTPSMIFFESRAGKIELGSDKSATTKMKITGYSHAAATAGMWDMWVKPDIRENKISYMTNMGNFIDTKARNVNDIEYSRKITYFTPEMSGFQAGVSYVPDSSNIGANATTDGAYHMHAISPGFGYNFDVKDAVGWGVSQKLIVNEDLSFKASVVGETGKVVARDVSNKTIVKNLKFKKLKTYTVGAEMKYSQFALSGGYSNYMKSFTSTLDDAGYTKSHIYSLGTKYSFDKLSISAHFFSSNHRKNKVNATTLALDYKLAPGLLPYIEITPFNASGWYKNPAGVRVSDSHKGALLLLGMKMEF